MNMLHPLIQSQTSCHGPKNTYFELRNLNPINSLPSNKPTNQHLDASPPPVLFPHPCCRLQPDPLVRPWVVQKLGLVCGGPLLLLLLVSYSTAPTRAPPLVIIPSDTVPVLDLYLPFQCSLPFLKHVSMEAP